MLTDALKNIGKNLLQKAFPKVYESSSKLRAISNPTAPLSNDKNKPPLIKAVESLQNTVKDSNLIASNTLEAILLQNDILGKIQAGGGMGGGEASAGILDWLKKFMPTSVGNAVGVGAEIIGGGVAIKKLSGAVRGKNGRYMSAKQAAANPEAVAVDAAKATAKPSIAGRNLGRFARGGSKLMRLGPVFSGLMSAIDEYGESGDAYKAGAVGVGSGAGAFGGAALGAGIGQVLIPVPVLGALIGGMIGGWAGSYLGGKAVGTSYDLMSSSSGSPGGSIEAQSVYYKAGEILTLKAQEIIISALEIQGLGTSGAGFGGGAPGGYSGGPNSVYARGGAQSVNTPTFRRGIGGQASQDGNRSGGGPVGPSASRGDVAGRPSLAQDKLPEQLPQGKERFFHQQGNVEGVDKRLVDTLKASSKDLPPGYRMEMISGHDSRGTGTKNHPAGVAVDVKLYDDKGRLIPHSGNSPGWKYYEQMYKSVQVRGKAMYPGSDWIWGGAWVGAASGPGDPMHYQIRSNVPGASQSSGMYDPNTGFDKNSGVNQGINFKANAMSKEERDSYVKSVQDRVSSESTPSQPSTEGPKQQEAPPPQPQPQQGPVSYDVDYKKAIQRIRTKYPASSFVSDDYIKTKMAEELKKSNPNLKLEGSRITGDSSEMAKLRQGLQDNLGEDPSNYLKPVEEQPKAIPVPVQTGSPELQRLRAEREKLRKDLKKAKQDKKKDEDHDDKDPGEHKDEPVKDNTRSDRAVWNINPQLHKDEHPQ